MTGSGRRAVIGDEIGRLDIQARRLLAHYHGLLQDEPPLAEGFWLIVACHSRARR